jgi:hypothetical protein
MVWPIFALALVSMFEFLNSQILQIFQLAVFKLVTLTLFAVSIIVFLTHFNEQRYEYKTPFLRGLYGNSQEQVASIDSGFKLVSENVEAGQMLMNCKTGLLSVNEKGFLGSDKWTWNIQPSEMLLNRLDRLELGQTMLSCGMNQSDTSQVASLVKEGKLTVIARGPNFLIYKVIKSLS